MTQDSSTDTVVCTNPKCKHRETPIRIEPPEIAKSYMKYEQCGTCGGKVVQSDIFCPYCGSPLRL